MLPDVQISITRTEQNTYKIVTQNAKNITSTITLPAEEAYIYIKNLMSFIAPIQEQK